MKKANRHLAKKRQLAPEWSDSCSPPSESGETLTLSIDPLPLMAEGDDHSRLLNLQSTKAGTNLLRKETSFYYFYFTRCCGVLSSRRRSWAHTNVTLSKGQFPARLAIDI